MLKGRSQSQEGVGEELWSKMPNVGEAEKLSKVKALSTSFCAI